MKYQVLRVWLAVFSVAASLATIQIIFLPRWPQAQIKADHRLLVPGHRLQLVGEEKATRRSDLAISNILTYELIPESSSVTVTHPSSQQDRLSLQLAVLSPRSLENFQIAAVTAGQPALEIKSRQLILSGKNQYVLGSLEGGKAIQSCQTQSGSWAITNVQFLSLPQAPISRRSQLERLLGLRLNRDYRCGLITLRASDTSQTSQQELKMLWRSIEGMKLLDKISTH